MQVSLNFKTSCFNIKPEVWEQKYLCLFCYFNFERNYDGLNLKRPYFLLNKSKTDKNETESKMKNSPHTFRETNLVLQLL